MGLFFIKHPGRLSEFWRFVLPTKHFSKDLLEFSKICFPLILSLSSTGLLIAGDRYIVSLFSLEAMNASALAGNAFFAVTSWLLFVAASSEYFVGQHNGRGEKGLLTKPVWQMCVLVTCFTPGVALLALLCDHLIFASSSLGSFERQFFYALMPVGYFSALVSAVAGYFLGQKKVWLVTFVTLVANALNLILDYVFVFGVLGFEGFGPLGAAYATDVVVALQFISLVVAVALQKEVGWRRLWRYAAWDSAYVVKLVQVSVPGALGHSLEIWAHTLLLKMVSLTSLVHMTTFTVVHSVYVVIFFACEGVSKTAATLAANAVGAGEYHKIRRVLRVCLVFSLMLGVLALGLLGINGEQVVLSFLQGDQALGLGVEEFAYVLQQGRLSLLVLCFFTALDGMTLALAGILAACGQTRVIFYGQGLLVWAFYVLPSVGVSFYLKLDPVWLFVVLFAYVAVLAAFYYWRLKKTDPQKMQFFSSNKTVG